MHHWWHCPVHRCCHQHPRPGIMSGCCPGQKWVLSWVFTCINGVWLNNLLTFYIVLGLKQEEDFCPYTWLPFTGEQKIQDHHSCWDDLTLAFTQSRFLPILLAAMLPQIHYTKINITFLKKFGPVFATEGQSATLTATVALNPNLANLQPEAQWYRDGNELKDAFYDHNYTVTVNYTCAASPGDEQARSDWCTVTVTAVENHNVMETIFIAH